MKINKITNLPRYLKTLRSDIDRLGADLQKVNYAAVTAGKDAESAKKRSDTVEDSLKKLKMEIDNLKGQAADLEHKLTVSKISKSPGPTSNAPAANLFADDHDLDNFYLEFENRFRGNEEEIRKKQEPYIKVFSEKKVRKDLPVADLGCGRGEFLQLVADNGYQPLGVDLNESMVKAANKKGHAAVQNDAISFLLKQKSGSLAAITGFHLAEHIPFSDLLILIGESYRCLAKGGVLILETPNPESLFVGAFTFHYDPSHLKPLPPAVMQFSAIFKGFENAEILRLQPELTDTQIKNAANNKVLEAALKRLFGPRDYALVATK